MTKGGIAFENSFITAYKICAPHCVPADCFVVLHLVSGTASADQQAHAQTGLSDLPGDDAYQFGVVANNIKIGNDFESNFAANNLIIDGTRDVENTRYTNRPGNIYFNHFESGILQLYSADVFYTGSKYQLLENNT